MNITTAFMVRGGVSPALTARDYKWPNRFMIWKNMKS